VETGCQGGQGSPRAVAPGGWMDGHIYSEVPVRSLAPTQVSCTQLHKCAMCNNINKGKSKGRGKVHPRGGHEGPKGE